MHLLAMGDVREGAVLAADEDPGVHHHHHEEAGLTIGETERCNRVDAVGVDLPDIPKVWQLNVHFLKMNALGPPDLSVSGR